MVTRRHWRQIGYFLLAYASVAFTQAGTAQPKVPPTQGNIAVVTEVTGAIGPASVRQVSDALREAHRRGAAVMILQLNTPGGLATSMRGVIEKILTSDIPIIGYVAPPGAHAASAGTYILYATSLAAMAPGTNLGAATPILIGRIPGLPQEHKPNREQDKDKHSPARDTLQVKMVNDAVALIRSLAEMHGRNADWAEKAVREGVSLSAKQAEAIGVIDLMASDVPDLLARADGRTVVTATGRRILHTRGLTIERLEPGFVTRFLAVISNPNVALILILIGVYGLLFEFANPGTIGPGVGGAISLVLGLYALNQLPIDYAGLALFFLGLALMAVEAITPTFGVLGLAGVVAFIVGAAMLVESNRPEFRISWSVIIATAALSGLVLIFLLGYVWRSQRSSIRTGREEMRGATARVVAWKGRHGVVWLHGERWQAHGPRGLKTGDSVRVIDIQGLMLSVSDTNVGHRPRLDEGVE